MKKKTVSGITLILLLIGMSTLAFNIQTVNADLKTIKNHNKEGNNEQARIVEHKITRLELEKLIRKIGVWEEGRNYNLIIDGHGTGLRPPTDNEWTEIAGKTYVVERVPLSQTAPSSVDHTTEPWFPPIGDQDGEGSCTTWAVGYYTKTFQEAKEHGWNLTGAEWEGGYYGQPTPEYQDKIISPDFIYHLINGGVDEGSSFYDAINLVCAIGASSWEKMPYDPLDSSSWPSEEAWREAPFYRGNSSGFEYMWLSTNDDIVSLKNWIASDHLAVIGVDAYQYDWLSSEDVWTLNNYQPTEINHANTIVGYDDSITYREGFPPQWRQGAFKIANSWGEGVWENVPDGCYWISYEAMKQRVGYCMFYRDRIGYDPKLMASFEIDHSKRGECDILIGMGNHSDPLATKSFSDLIDGGDQPFCSNDIVLDITEFEDAVSTVINQSFFLRAQAGVPPPHSGTYEWYSDGVSWSWFRLNKTFDIPETGATLNFWSYHEIEEDWDYGYVEVHDLDTDEWYTLPGLMTVSTLPERQDNPNCPLQFEPTTYYDAGRLNAFTGFSGDLHEEEMDLTPFAGHTIELYFTYWTDPYILELGWYVDDIGIPEIGFFDDVESGAGDWTYNGWYITTPPPATNGTLLSFSVEYYHSYSSESLDAKSTSHDVPVNITNQDVFAELTLKNIWTVDDDGPADFHTIQDAIDAAIDGNTVFVYNGTYYEHVVVNKIVSIVGENKYNTIIDGNGTGPAVVMVEGENNVTIRRFTLQKATGSVGFYSGHNNIIDNLIKDHTMYAIYLTSSDNTIIGNTFSNNNIGIYLATSHNVIYHNNFINNTDQVYFGVSFNNVWDAGYPSGGNHWSDYTDEDNHSGSNQDQAGSDGIGDSPYVIDANNIDHYPLMKPYGGSYDIGLTNITTSKTVVGQGYKLDITIKILNYGINAEISNLTAYANTTIIQTITNVVLTSRNSTTITFTWDTTGFAKGNYTISANITSVQGEADIADNTHIDGTVMVVTPGDANADEVVNILDAGGISAHWYPGPPIGPLGYDPNFDINSDGSINVLDAGIVSAYWTGPPKGPLAP